MCIRCPSESRSNICDKYSQNHHAENSTRQSTGWQEDVTFCVLDFDPALAPVLSAVCRGFQLTARFFMHLNREGIHREASQVTSHLYRFINGIGPDATHAMFYTSVSREARSLGMTNLTLIPSPESLRACNGRFEDDQLQRIWARIQPAFLDAEDNHELPAEILDVGAPAADIRTWLRRNPNLVQSVVTLNLSWLQLTCLPEEITLFAGLQALNLGCNLLFSLRVGVFATMPGLQRLHLHNNRLSALERGVFHNLTALHTLELFSNRLGALAPDLFDELPALQFLDPELD